MATPKRSNVTKFNWRSVCPYCGANRISYESAPNLLVYECGSNGYEQDNLVCRTPKCEQGEQLAVNQVMSRLRKEAAELFDIQTLLLQKGFDATTVTEQVEACLEELQVERDARKLTEKTLEHWMEKACR